MKILIKDELLKVSGGRLITLPIFDSYLKFFRNIYKTISSLF